MYQRRIIKNLSRNRPFCLLGAKGVGKTTVVREFAGNFSNWIHLDLETAADRAIFNFEVSAEETLKAISFLKGTEIRGNGTLIVLDEIYRCPQAGRWLARLAETGEMAKWRNGEMVDGLAAGAMEIPEGQTGAKGPLVVAISSVLTNELARLTGPEDGILQAHYLYPFSFEEFLPVINDQSVLEAFREVPVPYYAYEKLLNYFHLYALIGGMPEVTAEYSENHNLSGLRRIYEKVEERFIQGLEGVTAGAKSRDLAIELLQNTYPFAATRISFNRFGNMEKGSRAIGQAFKALESAFYLQLVFPGTSAGGPIEPDGSRFPRLHLLDTGLVNYFAGIQKPLFQSHDMNAIFEGQIARQVVGQEILAAEGSADYNFAAADKYAGKQTPYVSNGKPALNFWVRSKAQSSAEVDFVVRYNDFLIPVVVRSGEPGRLRSLHQFMDAAPHAYAVRLYAGKLAVQQTSTLRGKKFFLLNLPYFLAGKIRDHLKGFIRLANG